MESVTLMLNPVPPYDFTLSTAIFSSGDPHIRKAEDGRWWQVISIGGRLVLAKVSSAGTTNHPVLKVELRSDTGISSQEREKAGEIISRILNLDDYLAPFYQEVRDDPVLHAVTKRLRGLKVPTTPTVFEALVDSIIEQQIALTVARLLETRLTKMFGDKLVVAGQDYYAFPVPERIAAGKPEQFRACGLSAMKGEYLRKAAEQIAGGGVDLERMKEVKDPEQVIEELCTMKGVGRWTAELVLLRGMHRLDIIPADDLGLQRTITGRYQIPGKISGAEIRRIAERWGDWKGLAAYYLLVAERMGV